MKLKNLKIHNFRVIKDAEIVFDDQVICIIGKNGHGKSSIIEAIAWALYGNQAARTSKDEIKSTFADQKDTCEVSVSFSINGESYRVIRRLSGRTDKAEVELYRGDSSESIGVNETKNYVGHLLGLDWKGFLSSFLARQSELSALSDLPPSKRKDHISGMLGVEKLDKAITALKSENSNLSKNIDYLNNILAQKSTVEEIILELNVKSEQINSDIQHQELKYTEAKNRFESLNSSYQELMEQRIEFTKLTVDLEAESKNKSQLEEQLAQLTAQIQETEIVKAELGELEARLSKSAGIVQKVQQYDEIRHKQEFLNSMQQQVSALLKKQSSDEIKKKESEKKSEEISKELNALPKDLEKLIQKIDENLDLKRAEYQKLNAEMTVSKTELGKIKDQYQNIELLKADSICASCKRPLGEYHSDLKKHLEEEIHFKETELSTHSGKLQILKDEGTRLNNEKELKRKLFDKEKEYAKQLEIYTNEEKNLSGQISDRKIEIENLNKKVGEIGEVAYDDEQYHELLAEQREYEQLKINISKKQTIVERIEEFKTSSKSIEAKISRSKDGISSINKRLESLGFSEESFKQTTKEFNSAQNDFEKLNSDYQNLLAEKRLIENDQKRNEERIASFAENEKELERLKHDHFHKEKLVSLMTEYRHQLIVSIRPTLADRSSRLFNEMTDNKYNLVELDEKYELRVMDDGVFYGIERFSGGEKDLANLCLRLAISISLTESAGMDSSFIILDEVFGSQDDERKELIVKSLTKIKNSFPQIILITHIDSIKDGVEQIIEVVRNEQGYSEVLVEEA